jgi:hypothetical protein
VLFTAAVPTFISSSFGTGVGTGISVRNSNCQNYRDHSYRHIAFSGISINVLFFVWHFCRLQAYRVLIVRLSYELPVQSTKHRIDHRNLSFSLI